MFYWALTDLNFVLVNGSLFLWATTNVPCSLILRWTEYDPLYTVSWLKRRGIPHKAIEPTFPPEWRALAQMEPTPTLHHTFKWLDWSLWDSRSFIFTAVTSPPKPASQIGVFNYYWTFEEPPLELLWQEHWTT